MTQKLENLFGISPVAEGPAEETAEEAWDEATEQQSMLDAANAAIDKIDIALPTVRDLDASDKEMDALASLATETFNDLISLSMNVEPRYSGPIIQSASTILGHAVTAKIAKMDKKLKMIDLQLKKAKLDQTQIKTGATASEIDGEGTVISRNELLKQIIDAAKENAQ